MVLPVIAPATLVLIAGIVRLIAWLSSIVFVAMYVRDTVTETKEAEIQLSEDKTISDIINNPNLTPEQKTDLLRKYLEDIKDKPTDWGTIVLLGIGILAAAYLAQGFLGGKK